jgi:HlyD family type I secretion membrane fusion protein
MKQAELPLESEAKTSLAERPASAEVLAGPVPRRAPPATRAPRPPVELVVENAPSDSIRRYALIGWGIIALFFGGFGYWAATAPLHGAVIAPAVVKVEGNRKSVQHLDGGIVRDIHVKEGDRVRAGEIVLVLDDSQARAEFEVFTQQHLALRATEERLKAEAGRAKSLSLPTDLAVRLPDSNVLAVWEAQLGQFEARRIALEGQRKILREKIAQLESQIAGAEGTLKAYRAQLDSVRKEMEELKPLVDKGVIARPRYLQLERAAAGLEGQIADSLAVGSKSRQAISEHEQQIAQLEHERMTEVARDMRDTQAKLLEIMPKLANARAVLSRVEVRSPYSGRVVALAVFSVGGVVGKGERILDIVPDEDSLVIEAQVAVEDISDVRPNARANIHLTAYKQRATPTIQGIVRQVSADRLTEPKSGHAYYVALVQIGAGELEKLPHVHLYPGMPAVVMIPTEERTALDYMVGPLVQSFNRAFRER